MFITSLISVYTVKSLFDFFPCLYGLGERVCSYDPANAQTYFTLGDAVAGLGLVAAVIQLSNIEWRMVKKIQGRFLSNLWIIFGVFALIFVFMASFVTQVVWFVPPFNYPIFWEHLGLIFFILSPLLFWLVASNRRKLFRRRTSVNFYHVMMVSAVDGRIERLEAAVNILRDNLEDLVKSVGLIDSYFPPDKIPKDLGYAVYAEEMLNTMLSDRVVADYVACNRMDFLVAMLRLLKKYRISHSALSMGMNQIVSVLLNNKDSYLYRQLDYRGSTLYVPLYKLLFGDKFFVKEYMVLKQWGHGASEDANLNELKSEVFIKALESALGSGAFDDSGLAREISFVLFQLVDYSRWMIRKYKEDSQIWGKMVESIEYFLGHTFVELYKKALEKNKVCDSEKAAQLQGIYGSSLTASYAMVLVDFLGILSSGDDRVLERDRALDVTHSLLSVTNTDPDLDQLRKTFFEYMWRKVRENVEHGYFPAVTRVFLEIMCWKSQTTPKWYKDERRKLIAYLNTDLKPKMKSRKDRDRLMANFEDTKESLLLPNEIVFDKQKDKFYVIYRDGTRRVLR